MIARRANLVFGIAVLCIVPIGPVLAAPPTLVHLFPAGGQQGTTVEVTATGTFDTWPVEVLVDRDGLSIESQKTKGKLNVTVAADAAGVYWLRLHNKDGATTLFPFVVGTLPEVVEAESNDDPRKPQQLQGSCVVNGKLGKSGDVDGYSIPLKQGQALVVSMIAKRVLGSPMDAVLQICDENGFVLAQNDDAGSLDPQIVFEVPREGTYLIRTFAFPETPNSTINFAGADNFLYRLTITTGAFVEYCLPMTVQPDTTTTVKLEGWNIAADSDTITVKSGTAESRHEFVKAPAANNFAVSLAKETPIVASPASTSDKPQGIVIPCVVSGVLSDPGAVHEFSFDAKKGQKIDLRVESRSLHFPLDAVISVSDTSGKFIKEVDDASKERDPVYTLTAAQDGTYRVSIRDLHGRGGKRFAYRLIAKLVEPSYTLSVAADVFNLEPNKELEIPVTITRQNGFKEEIAIEAVGLPAGVGATPITSQASGPTAKSVTLKLEAEGTPKSGVFRIIGRVAEHSPAPAVFSQATPAHQHANLWLHAFEDKATQ